MSKIIGIDLGSTASCVSVWENGQPTIIVNENGQRTTKSVVGFKDNGEIAVGDAAERQKTVRPNETIYLIKRFMGRTWNEIINEVDTVSYKIVNQNNTPKVEVDGKFYTPQEISAKILQKLKKCAEDYLGETVEECVISCPAYYGDPQRTAIKEAATIAGMKCLRITNEPTAGAIASGIKHGKVGVYDLGGSTFDFSVVDCDDDIVEVLASSGDHMLGGYDFDERLVNYVVDEYKRESGVDLLTDNMAMSRVREACEKAKIELSSSMTTEINLPYITADATGPKHLLMTISRAKFEQLITDLIDKTRVSCQKALDDAKMAADELDYVVLVGGSTRVPAVEQFVRDFFHKEPTKNINPDEAVAAGMGYVAHQLSGDADDNSILLLDVTPLRLGIMTEGDISTEIIHENTTIPTKKEMEFVNAADNQSEATIVLLQGNRPLARQNRQLGQFNIPITPGPRGTVKISVTVDIDVNGQITVSAKDVKTGQTKDIRIDGSSNLSQEEIERMRAEAEQFEEQDKREVEKATKLNEIESKAYVVRDAINNDNFKNNVPDGQRQQITEKYEAVLKATKERNLDEAEKLDKELSELFEPIAKKAYESQAGSAQAGQPFEQAQPQQASETEVEDADFEEVH